MHISRNHRFSAALASVLLFGGTMQCRAEGAVAVSPAPLTCPPSVAISAAPTKSGFAVWRVFIGSELYLNSATPISGPPEMHGDLADYSSRKGKNEWSYTYDLNRDFPDGKWLECGYGAHNEVTLSQRLPDTVKMCTFVYRKGKQAGQNDIKINCK